MRDEVAQRMTAVSTRDMDFARLQDKAIGAAVARQQVITLVRWNYRRGNIDYMQARQLFEIARISEPVA